MNSIPANSPKWLSKRILEKGGILSFYDYMNIVLNDPDNGYYGSGKAKIGKDGDFVTSTSLSDDFLQARDEVHKCIKKLDWNGGFYRRDIGFKVIDK